MEKLTNKKYTVNKRNTVNIIHKQIIFNIFNN